METQSIVGELSTIAQEVLRKRVLLSDARGNPRETLGEMFRRVAWEVAKVERQFSSSADVQETATSFIDMMQALEFLPNSPTLMNSGLPNGQISPCFVLPLEDSTESFFALCEIWPLSKERRRHGVFVFPSTAPWGRRWSNARHLQRSGVIYEAF